MSVDDFKITKETRRVRFHLSDGTIVTGEVYVGLCDPHHSGPQRVGELLNSSITFIPARTPRGMQLLNLTHLVTAEVPAASEVDELLLLGEKRQITVQLARGRELVGEIYVSLPEGSRASDYFGRAQRFYPMFCGNTLTYINQNFIVWIQD